MMKEKKTNAGINGSGELQGNDDSSHNRVPPCRFRPSPPQNIPTDPFSVGRVRYEETPRDGTAVMWKGQRRTILKRPNYGEDPKVLCSEKEDAEFSSEGEEGDMLFSLEL